MLRSTVVNGGKPIYSLCWSPESDSILYCQDKSLHIVPTLPGNKQLSWKAHDGIVLQADWAPANSLIVSCGEDCKYRVWDQYGRQLYSSLPYDHVVTSVKWAPNGEMFAVGAFEMLRLCDKTGWSHSFDKPESGSLLNLSWSNDGTTVAGSGGNGSVIFGHIVDRVIHNGSMEAVLDENNKINVTDVLHELNEDLDFRERVVNMSMAYGFLVVCTTGQTYIYNTTQQNWTSPFVFDIRDSVYTIVQGAKYFALIDASQNFNIYDYNGKSISSPKYQGLRIEFLNKRHISLSSDVIAIIDPMSPKIVRVFDIMSGQPSSQTIEHTAEIVEMKLNQIAMGSERKMCFVDSNRDMFLTLVHKPEIQKICDMVDSFCWNDQNDMLSAIADCRHITWFYPNAIYVDRDLMKQSQMVKDCPDVGKLAVMQSFTGTLCTVLRLDGGVATL
jgi:intraflagellar transport protein 80